MPSGCNIGKMSGIDKRTRRRSPGTKERTPTESEDARRKKKFAGHAKKMRGVKKYLINV